MKANYEKIFRILKDKESNYYNLPKSVDLGFDILPLVYNESIKYLEIIEEFDSDKLGNALNIVKALLLSIENYYNGKVEIANRKMNLLLSDKGKMREELSVISLSKFFGDEISNGLFKARVGNYQSNFSVDDILHVPFNKRNCIKNNRYSINGTPCLYLGTSLYDCWIELDKPKLSEFWVSKFKLKDKNCDLKILDLSSTKTEIIERVINENISERKEELIEKFIMTWILQFACAISVKEPSEGFREDYIVPQLVMQSIESVDIKGVVYLSTKIDILPAIRSSKLFKNIAIPAYCGKMFRESDDGTLGNRLKFSKEEFEKNLYSSELKEIFEWTPPINFDTYFSVKSKDNTKVIFYNGIPIRNLTSSVSMFSYNITHIPLGNGFSLEYQGTNFHIVEELLRDIESTQSINTLRSDL